MLETNADHELSRCWLSVLQGLESGKPSGKEALKAATVAALP